MSRPPKTLNQLMIEERLAPLTDDQRVMLSLEVRCNGGRFQEESIRRFLNAAPREEHAASH